MNNNALKKPKQHNSKKKTKKIKRVLFPGVTHHKTSTTRNGIHTSVLINCTLSKEISWDIKSADKYSLEESQFGVTCCAPYIIIIHSRQFSLTSYSFYLKRN